MESKYEIPNPKYKNGLLYDTKYSLSGLKSQIRTKKLYTKIKVHENNNSPVAKIYQIASNKYFINGYINLSDSQMRIKMYFIIFNTTNFVS
jgi:hypothetical protein